MLSQLTSRLLRPAGIPLWIQIALKLGTTLPITALCWYLTWRTLRHESDQLETNERHVVTEVGDEVAAEGFKVLKICIPQRAVGAVIGKSGAVIRGLQRATRTKINFSSRDRDSSSAPLSNAAVGSNGLTEASAKPATSVEIIIKGLTQSVAAAESEIKRIVEDVPEVEEDVLEVSARYMGKLIGRNGETVRQLQRQAQCRVVIERREDSRNYRGDNVDKKRITLTGTRDQIDMAKYLINDLIMKQDAGRKQPQRSSMDFREVREQEGSTSHLASSNDQFQNECRNPETSASIETETVQESQLLAPSNVSDQSVITFPECKGAQQQTSDEMSSAATSPLIEEEFQSMAQAAVMIGSSSGQTAQLPRHDCAISVMVSAISPTDLYLHMVCEEGTLLEPMITQLTNYCASSSAQLVTDVELQLGCLVAAYFADEGTWQRARVIERLQKESFSVNFLDYGDSAELQLPQLRRLPDQFLSLPFQAVRATLAGFPAAVELSASSLVVLEQLTYCGSWREIRARVESWSAEGVPAVRLSSPASGERDLSGSCVWLDVGDELRRLGHWPPELAAAAGLATSCEDGEGFESDVGSRSD